MINHMLKNTFQVLMTRYTYFIGVKKYAMLFNVLSAFQTLVRIWTFFWPKGPDFVFILLKSLAFI